MYCIPRKFPPAILLICFVFTVVIAVKAQKSTGNSQGVAPVIVLDSTKEQDGLVGPVRRVQTEIAKLDVKSGVVTEGPRQVLEVTTYNLKGERVDNTSYPVPGPAGTEQYKYDDKGNIVEMTLRGADGTILSREVYSYESDGVGNWTKMTTSLVLFEDGKLRYEPVEATYRTIAYFYDETIAKLLDAHSTSSKAATSATTTIESGSPQPKNSPATNPALPPDSAPPKRIEAEKTSSSPEGSKVSSRPAPETPAKAAPLPSNTHKAAFELYKTGRQHFDLGNPAAAIQAYKQAIEIEPTYADVHLSLGHAYLRLQKSQDAIKAFKEAVRINPEMEEAHYGLGFEYFRAGNMKDAAQAFKKAVRIRPNMAKAHYGLALAYQEMGKQDLLLEEYRILQTLDSQLAKKLSDSFPEFNLPCNGRRCD